MKVYYIPLINAPLDPSSATRFKFALSQWRFQLEKDFMAAHTDMTNAINDVRKQKAAMDKVKYINALHEKKEIRQKAWMAYLENAVCTELKKAIEELKTKPGYDATGMIVAAIPEFFWRDIDDNPKTDKPYANYGRPFYDAVLMDFMKKPADAAENFHDLTRNQPNLIVFAGTFWWKIPDISGNKDEKYLNTLTVFHSGQVQFTWNKLWVSQIDGAGDPGEPKRLDDPINIKPGSSPAKHDSSFVPLVSFMGKTLSMDICLDFVAGNSARTTPVSKTLIQDAGKPVPDIHVLIAGGMGLDPAYIYAGSLFLRCDAAPIGGTHAQVYTLPANTEVKAPTSPPATNNCFYIFDAVTI